MKKNPIYLKHVFFRCNRHFTSSPSGYYSRLCTSPPSPSRETNKKHVGWEENCFSSVWNWEGPYQETEKGVIFGSHQSRQTTEVGRCRLVGRSKDIKVKIFCLKHAAPECFRSTKWSDGGKCQCKDFACQNLRQIFTNLFPVRVEAWLR